MLKKAFSFRSCKRQMACYSSKATRLAFLFRIMAISVFFNVRLGVLLTFSRHYDTFIHLFIGERKFNLGPLAEEFEGEKGVKG